MRDCAAFLKTIVVLLLLSSPAVASSLAEALPPDVYIFAETPDLPAARAAGAATAYGEILAEPDVARFINEGFPALSSLADGLRSSTGKGLREILDFGKGEAALAVVPADDDPYAVVVIVNVGRDTKPFEGFLAAYEARTGLAWETYEIPGATVKSGAVGRFQVSYALAGDCFVLSSSSQTLASVVAGILSGRSDNLASDAAFNKCRSLSTLANPQISAYVNSALLISKLVERLPPQAGAFVRESGLLTLGGVFYATRSEQRGFIDEMIYYFPTGREGLFAALKPSPPDARDYVAMLPAASMSASWSSIDLQALGNALSALYNSIAPQTRVGIDDFLAGVETAAEIRLKDELVAGLGRNVVSYTAMASSLLDLGFSGGFGQHVTLVELSDPPRFRQTVEAVWKYGKERLETASTPPDVPPAPPSGPAPVLPPWMKIEGKVKMSAEQFGQHTIYQVAVPLPFGLQVVPSFAVKEDWVIVGTDAMAVKSALGAPLVFKTNLRANSDYRSAAGVAGPGNAGISYANTRALFDSLYPTVAFGMPFVLAQLGGNMPTDQLMLPPVTAISPHLFGSATATNVSPDSIRVTSYGPIGLVRTGYAVAVTGAAVGKWFVETRMKQSPLPRAQVPPAARVDDLQILSTALADFAAEHQGAYPSDPTQLQQLLASQPYNAPAVLGPFAYVPGLSSSDDTRLIVAFDRTAAPAGRRVLLVGGTIMHFSDDEIAEQVGGWLLHPADPDAACVDNVRALAASVRRYAASHDGEVPRSLDMQTSYRFAPLVTTCPSGAVPRQSCYAAVPGINIANVPLESTSEVVLIYETGPTHEDRPAVGLLDGTVRRLTRQELKDALEKTRLIAR